MPKPIKDKPPRSEADITRTNYVLRKIVFWSQITLYIGLFFVFSGAILSQYIVKDEVHIGFKITIIVVGALGLVTTGLSIYFNRFHSLLTTKLLESNIRELGIRAEAEIIRAEIEHEYKYEKEYRLILKPLRTATKTEDSEEIKYGENDEKLPEEIYNFFICENKESPPIGEKWIVIFEPSSRYAVPITRID